MCWHNVIYPLNLAVEVIPHSFGELLYFFGQYV
ncbi:Uncharacterised protein [Vibrio cholerae]|nr:Uncharacterised protein [Vibrio cholerae]